MKKIAGLLLPLVFIAGSAYAQAVTVEGMGTDKDAAVKDAMRAAVEAAVGTYIRSETLVENSAAALDEIYAKSQGFVKSVDILSENSAGGLFRVRARIDVDIDPNSALMSRLNMLMLLNEPRIAIVIQKNDSLSMGGTGAAADDISEAVMNEACVTLGFTRLADAAMVAKLKNSELLNNIYNGTLSTSTAANDYPIDYLVFGKSSTTANKITLMNQDKTFTETQLTTGKAVLNVKIIKFDTGEIIGSFTADGTGVDNSSQNAQNKALKAAAEQAAVKLEEKFKQAAANPVQGIQINISAEDSGKIDQLISEIKNLSGVNGAWLRSQGGGKALVEADSYQKPHILVQLLKERTKLNVFVEKITGNTIDLIVS
jgi:hypothetical protein